MIPRKEYDQRRFIWINLCDSKGIGLILIFFFQCNAVPDGKSKLRGIGRGNHHIVIGKLQGNITAVRFDSIKEDILQHIIFVHRPQSISAELFRVRIVRFHFFCKFQQGKHAL